MLSYQTLENPNLLVMVFLPQSFLILTVVQAAGIVGCLDIHPFPLGSLSFRFLDSKYLFYCPKFKCQTHHFIVVGKMLMLFTW